jgi:small subunit ribosomal protein S13
VARLIGVDLPKNKNVEIALTYIFGIGLKTSQEILKKAGIELTVKVKELSEDQLLKLREIISNFNVEGDLRRSTNQDVRRLIEIGCYRGQRHRKKLPCRGQRTHTNARTKRGKKVAIAGKKKVTK